MENPFRLQSHGNCLGSKKVVISTEGRDPSGILSGKISHFVRNDTFPKSLPGDIRALEPQVGLADDLVLEQMFP